MKRRQAIKHLVIVTSAAALLPSCQPEAKVPVYGNIRLDKKQRKFLEQFTDALLPKDGTEVTTPETTADFILTVFNDCHSPEDIQKYMDGLTELQVYVKQNYNGELGPPGTEKQVEIFAYLSGGEDLSEPLKFFFDLTRRLTVEHFTSSEFFLRNVMKWEYAPGRFLGCVAV